VLRITKRIRLLTIAWQINEQAATLEKEFAFTLFCINARKKKIMIMVAKIKQFTTDRKKSSFDDVDEIWKHKNGFIFS